MKVAPDLDNDALDDVVAVCLERGASGLIAVNTTVSRTELSVRVPLALRDEPGGLSGRPLAPRALEVVRRLRKRAGEHLPIVGCGGISTADDARRMLDAGAALVQLDTGFIYEGPGIARRIARELAASATSASAGGTAAGAGSPPPSARG